MPDVSISNTIVQEDLASGESVTVPSGESWDVTLFADVDNAGDVKLNGEIIAVAANNTGTLTAKTVVHDGDTIKGRSISVEVRGWVVREP